MKELTILDARNSLWNRDDLVERLCPICGFAGVPKYIRPDQLFVRECFSCGTLFVSPAPSECQISGFYSEYSIRHQRLSALPDFEIAQNILASTPEDNIIIQEICSMKNIQGAKCLDVGFGRGQYLHWIKSLGGVPVGVDLDPSSVRFAKEYLKISDVKEGNIFDISDEEKYDVVMMIDFVEHPMNILKHIEKAVSILEKSGLLVVWTPNASFVNYEEDPVFLRVDLEHMQYFTFKTCVFLAEKLKLRLVHLECIDFPGLTGIDMLQSRRHNVSDLIKSRIRRLIKSVPGFHIVKAVRSSFKLDSYRRQRLGRYHLFCIFENIT